MPKLDGREVYIWGTSGFLNENLEIFKNIESKYNVVGFIDGNTEKIGGTILGYEIFSPIVLENFKGNKPFVYIFSSFKTEISLELVKIDYEKELDFLFIENVGCNIDIVGMCNLKCPSCPVGNSEFASRPFNKFMDVNLFEKIIKKIKSENESESVIVKDISLFNWTEPLLHPNLPEIITIVKENGLRCHLSSNLNLIRNLENVIMAEPDSLRISISAYNQENYSKTHRNGDVERVKRNMYKLKEIINKLNSPIRIEVLYHMYRHNLKEDFLKMKELCEELNFTFEPVYAFLMPIEKNIEYFNNVLQETDKDILSMFILSPEDYQEISLKYKKQECRLIKDININSDGSVALCCGVYDSKYTVTSSFLEMSILEQEKLKMSNKFCKVCIQHGMHITSIYGGIDEINERARQVTGISSIEQRYGSTFN